MSRMSRHAKINSFPIHELSTPAEQCVPIKRSELSIKSYNEDNPEESCFEIYNKYGDEEDRGVIRWRPSDK